MDQNSTNSSTTGASNPASKKGKGSPEEMLKAHEWLAQVADILDLPQEVQRSGVKPILDLTKDVAHNRSRPSAPVTAFLVGLAAGLNSADRSPEALQEAIEQALAPVAEAAR
ncbi:DUF6457 domain-containing protein [Corynebacterium falsenii]|nr:DUF6457 domain-containing protein [Corynebacterium falsenii]HJF11867.1 DUF6457 domain-containing protein [Corynebacterium falsenii]